MNNQKTRTSVLRHLLALQQMTSEELQEKWKDLYGCEAPTSYRKSFMLKCLAYRTQELFYGGLSDKVKTKLSELAKTDEYCLEYRAPAKSPSGRSTIFPGTRLIREWRGERHEVIARERGFEYKGQMFRSLTAVATHITKCKQSGNAFFGLRERNRQKKSE